MAQALKRVERLGFFFCCFLLQQLLYKGDKKNRHKSFSGKESNKRFFAGVGSILIVALLLNVFLTNANKNAQATDAGETDVNEEVNLEVNLEEVNLEEVYRQGVLGDDAAVIEALEAIGYKSLEEKDRNVLNTLYLDNGEYGKAIENNPDLAGEIATKLVEEERIEELQKLGDSAGESNPVVAFEVAAAEEKWKTVIDLRNQIALTEKRISTIVSAFIQTGDLQTAKAFVNEKAPDNEEILNQLLTAEKQQNELEALKTEKAEKQKLIDADTDEAKIKAAKERLKEIDQQIMELEKKINKE